MYEFKAPFLESRLLALHNASLNGVSSEAARNLVRNDARFNSFSTHTGFLLAIFACCILALSGCGGVVTRGASASSSLTDSLVASPDSVDFGAVKVGNSANAQVTLSNDGSEQVNVSGLQLSNASFSIDGAAKLPIIVAAGESLTFKVHFKPKASTDTVGELSVMTSTSASPATKIKLHGKGADSGTPFPTLSALSCASASMTGAGSDTCTVTLSAAAPSGGMSVNLSSSSGAVKVPSSVTVPANATSVGFTATVSAVSSSQSVALMATLNGVAKTFSLQLNASSVAIVPTLSTLSCASSSMNGAGSDACTVTLSAAAPSGGISVTLSTSNGAVKVPSSVTVPGNATSVGFTATVSAVKTTQSATLTAKANGVTKSFTLQLNPAIAPVLSTLSCASASMAGNGSDACTVTLSAAALSGGMSVTLSSSNGAVRVPSSVTVPGNATSVGFTAAVSAVKTTQSATLTAKANGVTKSFALKLYAGTATLSVNSTSIGFGNVELNTTASQPLTLKSTGTAPVTISAATLTGTGFTISGVSFPLVLNPSQTAALNVQFAPSAKGLVTGRLTISSTGGTAVISLSGTGEVALHEVDLSWDAPGSSSVSIVGYNVYRSAAAVSSYQRMNSAAVTPTQYADKTVQSGKSYDYVVKSLDSAGVESAPSNVTRVVIP